MGLQAYLILAAVCFLHRPVRRRDAAQHDRHPARHRVDAERGQHQPGRVLAFQCHVTGMIFTLFTICITVSEAAIGLAHRHPAVPRAPDRDGRSSGSAQGMMTDPGGLALVSLLLPAARSSSWRSRAHCDGSDDPRRCTSILVAAGSLARGHRAWRGHAEGQVTRLVWEWLPSDGVRSRRSASWPTAIRR